MTRSMTNGQPSKLFAQRQHAELGRGLNRIHDLAVAIGREATPFVSADVIDVLGWLDRMLEPPLAWEDGWLFPEIDRRLGTPWATRSARVRPRPSPARPRPDPVRPVQLALDPHGAREELRADLFGLEALVRAHIEREEQLLLPVLDDVEPRGGLSVQMRRRPSWRGREGHRRGRVSFGGRLRRHGRRHRDDGQPRVPGRSGTCPTNRDRPTSVIALRDAPTLRHYDPERLDVWITESGRGARLSITPATPMPLDIEISWE